MFTVTAKDSNSKERLSRNFWYWPAKFVEMVCFTAAKKHYLYTGQDLGGCEQF